MRMNHYCTKQIFQLGLAKDHNFSVFFGTLLLVSNETKVLKGWGAIAKLKKKQELLVRFGYNLGDLFRDSP